MKQGTTSDSNRVYRSAEVGIEGILNSCMSHIHRKLQYLSDKAQIDLEMLQNVSYFKKQKHTTLVLFLHRFYCINLTNRIFFKYKYFQKYYVSPRSQKQLFHSINLFVCTVFFQQQPIWI